MSNNLSVTVTKDIQATPDQVWHALTDPAQIRQYLFGTDTVSDWKKGSPITYTGEWNGRQYTDKGTIIDIRPQELLHTTYWSSMGGKEDKPENYNNVIYKLEPHGDHTTISITQDNIGDEAGQQHMRENWGMVLDGMKELLEKRS